MPAEFISGSPAQIEWAGRIRLTADAEFTRVAAALRAVAAGQQEAGRQRTETVIAILEEKRAEVMARNQAGYFIREWQELSDQVRRLITADARYQDIQKRQKP